MKKIFILLVVNLLIAAGANAAQCTLPKSCKYLDSEFSTGGGDKVSYVMEVTCQMPKSEIVKFTHWKISAGSLFGIGRITAPKKIVFKKGSGRELKCSY